MPEPRIHKFRHFVQELLRLRSCILGVLKMCNLPCIVGIIVRLLFSVALISLNTMPTACTREPCREGGISGMHSYP